MLKIILLILPIIGLINFIRNIKIMNRVTKEKQYRSCCDGLINKDEDNYEKICTYINKETDPGLLSRAYLLKLYYDLKNDLDYDSSLKNIDIKKVFFVDNAFKHDELINASDLCVWIIIDMLEGKNTDHPDVADTLMSHLKEIPELSQYIEYKIAESYFYLCKGNKEDSLLFLKELMDGSYEHYQYDKRLIGLYKRMAACALKYFDEPLDSYDENVLKEFYQINLGKTLMSLLFIDKTYENA